MQRLFRIFLFSLMAFVAARTHAQSTDLSINFNSPTNGQTVTAPLFLRVDASESSGGLLTVEFFANGQSIGVVSNRPIVYASGGIIIVRAGAPPPPPSIVYVFSPFTLFWNPQPGDYTLTARVTDYQGITADSAPVNVTVVSTPVVSVEAAQPMASPNAPGLFTIRRTGNTNADLSVPFSLTGSAKNGIDYVSVSNSVTIPAGQTSADVLITPLVNVPGKTRSATFSFLFFATPQAQGTPPESLIVPYNPPYIVGSPSTATVYLKENGRNAHRPAVRIVQPKTRSLFAAGSDISITADAVDRDTYVMLVEFFDGTTKLGETPNSTTMPIGQHVPFGFTWTNAPVGPHLLRARATDNQGMHEISAPVRIQVLPAP